MPKTQQADRASRGGPVNIWLPGPIKDELQRLKAKHKVSWSKLLALLLRGEAKK